MRGSDLSLRGRLAAAVIDHSPPWSTLAASRAMGRAARLPLPPGLSKAAVKAYARMFSVDLDEVDPAQLAEGFSSFDAFFTRSLRAGARTVDKSPGVLVSPCDGRLREIAEVESEGVIVAKGNAYSLTELLADADLAERFVGGRQLVIYLHPRDYHRVHTPVSGLARRVVAIPGRLLPVNDASLEREPRLCAVNERHVHVLDSDEFGAVAVVMVAAFGVGHMSCSYHPIETHADHEIRVELDPPALLTKGDELGVFHLGSTVVLLVERGLEAAEGVHAGQRVKFGQALLRREGEGA